MTARALMLQGTGSDVGKSMLVAALCRIARQQGVRVAPFKAQNMSNNAAACVGGGEIGRAQALQAQAAGIEATVDMNPVLLKPESDRTAQLVVHGAVVETVTARDYFAGKKTLLAPVMESFSRLQSRYDLILVEGAGSPSEINLRARDIANMGFARAADVPVCLVGDIDRGGVIAAIVGTWHVLDPQDRKQIEAFVINRFRGDISLFTEGYQAIEQHTSWPCLGVVPWLAAASRLPAEDAVVLDQPELDKDVGTGLLQSAAKLRIAVPMLSRIANFDDVDPLRLEPSVELSFVAPGQPVPRTTDVILLPGTKSTIADLAFMRAQGWDHDIHSHVRHGGYVLGICGGYQMLGRVVRDPDGVEGKVAEARGLGLLDVETVLGKGKTVQRVTAACTRSGIGIEAYEIHVGHTHGPDCERPMFSVSDRSAGSALDKADGAMDRSGRVCGTYLHGMMRSDEYRHHLLHEFSGKASGGTQTKGSLNYDAQVEASLDELAQGVAKAVDVERLFQLAR